MSGTMIAMNLFTFLKDEKDFFSSVQAIATSLSVMIGAAVAVWGLQTWRKELKGKDRYEALKNICSASQVLKALLRFAKVM